jgi:hypothetical protein
LLGVGTLALISLHLISYSLELLDLKGESGLFVTLPHKLNKPLYLVSNLNWTVLLFLSALLQFVLKFLPNFIQAL